MLNHELDTDECQWCGQMYPCLMKCAKCQDAGVDVHFCSHECQNSKGAWPEHSQDCGNVEAVLQKKHVAIARLEKVQHRVRARRSRGSRKKKGKKQSPAGAQPETEATAIPSTF